MPPPRRRQRVQLTTYDRELLQAVNDGRLDPEDPEVQTLLQRLEQPPAGDPWQTDGVNVQPEAPPPQMPTFRSLGRGAWNAVKDIATQRVGSNPYSQDIQDAARARDLPTDPRIRGPWGVLEAATGMLPAAAGTLYDLATGETDPDIPDLVHDPPTWRGTLEERGAPTLAQYGGTMLDLFTGPEDLVVPGASAVTGLFGAAVGTGRILRRTLRAGIKAGDATAAAARLLDRMTPVLDDPAALARLKRQLDADPSLSLRLESVLPEELPVLLRSRGGIDTFLKSMDELPHNDVLKAAASLGEEKLGWYAQSRAAIKTIFGDDADLFAGVLAAMSPQTSVESNLTNTLNFFVNWRAAGRPRQADAVKKLITDSVQGSADESALPAWIPNTVRVITDNTQTISGPKVDSFWANLRDRPKHTQYGEVDPERMVVLDAWMSHLFGVPAEKWFGGANPAGAGTGAAKKADAARKKAGLIEAGDPGLQARYIAGSAKVREIATELGVTPSEAQEAMWSASYALYNKAKSLGIPVSEVLSENLLTAADIAGTPDFSTLLRSGDFSRIIGRDPELASRLPALADLPPSAWIDRARTSDTGRRLERGAEHLAGVAALGRLFDRLQNARRVESAAATGRIRGGGDIGELLALSNTEAVGDAANTSLFASPQRESVSTRLFEGARNPFGNPAALEAVSPAPLGRAETLSGHWVDPAGQTQNNPVLSMSSLIPEGSGRAAAEGTFRSVADIQAGIWGQTAAAHTVLRMGAPVAKQNVVNVSGVGARNLNRAAFKQMAAALPEEWVAVSRRKGVVFLHIDPDTFARLPVTSQDIGFITQHMRTHIPQATAKGKTVEWKGVGAEDVAKNPYRMIAGDAPPGSGTRAARMVGEASDYSRMSGSQRRALDPPIQRLAQEALDAAEKGGGVLRDDERRMLEIIAGKVEGFTTGGASALAKALGDPSQVLPVLAGLGLWELSDVGAAVQTRQPDI